MSGSKRENPEDCFVYHLLGKAAAMSELTCTGIAATDTIRHFWQTVHLVLVHRFSAL